MHTSAITLARRNYAALIIVLVVLFSATVAIADIISGLSTTSSSTNVTITNLTIAKPSDVAVGDVMLAGIAIHDGNAVAVSAPSGWTQVLRTDNDTNISIVSYWKTVGTSEPANYTWVLSPQTRAEGGITRYSGVDGSNPIGAAAGNFGRSKVATTSSITTTAADEEVVTLFALHVGSNNFAGNFFSTPSGMTEKYDSSKTAAGPTIASFDVIQAVAGIAGSKSSTISGNPNQQRDWASQQIALRPASTSTLQNGLISYWKFDESSGDATDATGNGKTLTNLNSATYATGKINNGIDLERDISQYLTRTNDGYDTSSSTVSCWIKMEENPSVASIVRDSINAGSKGFDFRINEENKVQLSFGDGSNGAGIVLGSTSLSLGTFYMVTGTWTPAGKEVFVNDVSDGIETNPATITEGGDSFEIGGSSINPDQYFDGIIDECGIWNRVLTQSELTSLYNNGSGIQYPF